MNDVKDALIAEIKNIEDETAAKKVKEYILKILDETNISKNEIEGTKSTCGMDSEIWGDRDEENDAP